MPLNRSAFARYQKLNKKSNIKNQNDKSKFKMMESASYFASAVAEAMARQESFEGQVRLRLRRRLRLCYASTRQKGYGETGRLRRESPFEKFRAGGAGLSVIRILCLWYLYSFAVVEGGFVGTDTCHCPVRGVVSIDGGLAVLNDSSDELV